MHKYMSIVLDTTYILPLFNIETKKFKKKFLLELVNIPNAELIVPKALIIEAKWVVISLIRQRRLLNPKIALQDFNDGLSKIKYGDIFTLVDIVDENVDKSESDIFLTKNIRNHFDRILLASAIEYSDILLTEDSEILKLRNKNTKMYDNIHLLCWRELKEMV